MIYDERVLKGVGGIPYVGINPTNVHFGDKVKVIIIKDE